MSAEGVSQGRPREQGEAKARRARRRAIALADTRAVNTLKRHKEANHEHAVAGRAEKTFLG